jgi:hypothetical protein
VIFALIALGVAAAVVTHGTSLAGYGIAVAVTSFWSNGVMANFRRDDPDRIPNWAAWLSMASAAVSLGLIVTGAIIR